MTTICITVLVYIPSYMGTSAWYRTVISSFMFIFLGTLTWASIFAPKIYIILFRPHKNIPMRPSVSSITLGVITPSPTGTLISNLSDQNMRSRQNSLTPNEDEPWEGLWAKFDSERDVNENEASNEQDDSWKMSEAQHDDEFDEYCEEKQNESTEMQTRTNNSPELQHENCNKMPQKKTSVVHFEDELTTEHVEAKEKQISLRRKSSSAQGGILRKPYTSENLENFSNGLGPKKKKTSLVRFQDEVANFEANFPDCHKSTLPASREEPDQGPSFNEKSLDEETGNEKQAYCTCVTSLPEKLTANSVAEHGRKRKISVFSFQ